MNVESLGKGTCNLCGEDSELFCWMDVRSLNEEDEGVCCKNCAEFYIEQDERRAEVDAEFAEDEWGP